MIYKTVLLLGGCSLVVVMLRCVVWSFSRELKGEERKEGGGKEGGGKEGEGKKGRGGRGRKGRERRKGKEEGEGNDDASPPSFYFLSYTLFPSNQISVTSVRSRGCCSCCCYYDYYFYQYVCRQQSRQVSPKSISITRR